MNLLFAPEATTLLQTTEGGVFPVSRVFCVGRNYAARACEMGKDPDRDPPFYFPNGRTRSKILIPTISRKSPIHPKPATILPRFSWLSRSGKLGSVSRKVPHWIMSADMPLG